MATSIAFTDGTGAATLTNGQTGNPGRFKGWTPGGLGIGPSETASGTGAVSKWRFRTDYTAKFDLPYIPASSLDVAIRLKLHLEDGGNCTVTTGDAGSRTYTATLRPGGTVDLVQSDGPMMEYTLTLELLNASAAVMLCVYE
jgi:hypothetical protein